MIVPMPKISAFIIARNEQDNIARALKSLLSFCDEIILVDTGSTDKTKEIALNYTDKIFDFKWVDDFSASRNFALSKCTGDWIIYLDADDELDPENQNLIQETILNSPPDVIGYYVNYRYSGETELLTARIFRNLPGLHFAMPVHEYLELTEEQKKAFRVVKNITVIHHKDARENQNTILRNIKILQKSLKHQPENHHLRFFLAREKYNLGEFAEAREILSKLANNPPVEDPSYLYLIFLYLGLCYQKIKDAQMAIKAFQKAESYYPRLAEPLVYEGDTWLYQMNNPDKAALLYKQVLAMPKPETGFPVNASFYYDYPKKQLQKIEKLKLPIALVCGYYGIPNIGDELMLAAIIKKYPRHRIIVASYNPEITRKIHDVEAVPHHHAWFDHALTQAQLVIIGGGTLFHDQGLTQNDNVRYYCGIINQAVTQHRDVVIYGVGVDKIGLKSNQQLISENFRHCSEITVRDELSKTRLLKYGVISPQIRVADDLACQLKPSEYLGTPAESVPGNSAENALENSPQAPTLSVQSAGEGRPLIGINLCPPVVGGAADYQQKIEKELVPFIIASQKEYSFIFIPGTEKDLELASYLKEKTGLDIPVFSPEAGGSYLSSYFKIINSCSRVIAARFHLVLLAHLLQKPVEALPYAEKTDSLIKKYQIPRFRFPPFVPPTP